jgi:hypothetical protein
MHIAMRNNRINSIIHISPVINVIVVVVIIVLAHGGGI